MKEEFGIGNLWWKITNKEHLIDALYGIRDGTNNHGHMVISGSEAIYNRQISGANLFISGSGLFLNNDLLISL